MFCFPPEGTHCREQGTAVFALDAVKDGRAAPLKIAELTFASDAVGAFVTPRIENYLEMLRCALSKSGVCAEALFALVTRNVSNA